MDTHEQRFIHAQEPEMLISIFDQLVFGSLVFTALVVSAIAQASPPPRIATIKDQALQ